MGRATPLPSPQRPAPPYTIRGVKGSPNTITPFARTQIVVQAQDGAIQEVRRWDEEGRPVGDGLAEEDLQDLQGCEEFTPLGGDMRASAPMDAWLVGRTADPDVIEALCARVRCRRFELGPGSVLLLEDAREAEQGREAVAEDTLARAMEAARTRQWERALGLATNAWYLGNALNVDRLALLAFCAGQWRRPGTERHGGAEWYLACAKRSYGAPFARQVEHRLEHLRGQFAPQKEEE